MKVLIDSYNTVYQNDYGGMQKRISDYTTMLKKEKVDVKLFNKWEDKIEEFDILHIMKITSDTYSTLKMANRIGLKTVISPTINKKNILQVKAKLILLDLLKIESGERLIKKSLNISDNIIVETPEEKRYICNVYKIKEEKVSIIPTGVGMLNTDYDVNKEKIDIKDFILHVGRFDDNKNQLNIIKALKGTGLKVVFIGGPSKDDPKYYEICKSNADDNFYFFGWIDNNNSVLEEAYRKAKVVILPSYKETFGISLVEGGLYGANLVCSKSLPILELGIRDICTTCNPNNIDDIKNAILLAYNKDKDEKQPYIMKELFSLENIAKKHIDIYRQIDIN